MYVIVWEFRPRTSHREEFEQAYGSSGLWVQFFRPGAGYLGTELVRDVSDPTRYLTIDRWISAAAL